MEDQVKRLWRRYKEQGDEKARDEIVLSHLPLVRFVLGRLPISLPRGLGEEDLASAGVVALLRAVEDFDIARGLEFATFAVPRIRGAMYDELRAHDVVPRSIRQRASAIEQACVELGRKGPAPSVEDIAGKVGTTPEEVERTMAAVGVRSFLSLEAFCRTSRGGRDQRILENAIDASVATPLAHLMAKERDSILGQAIAALPEAERRVIVLYYQHEFMLKEIAEVLSVTKSRVSQIHTRALFRLRATIASLAASRAPTADKAVS